MSELVLSDIENWTTDQSGCMRPPFSIVASPPISLLDDISLDGVRYVSRGKRKTDLRILYELKPQLFTLHFSEKKPHTGYNLTSPYVTYTITLPYVFFFLADTYARGRIGFAFFSNREFKSFNDKVCIACLPNLGYHGLLCWNLGVADEVPAVNSLLSALLKQLVDPRFNLDIENIGTVYEYGVLEGLNLVEKTITVRTTTNRILNVPVKASKALPFLDRETKRGTEIIWPEISSVGSYLEDYAFRFFVSRLFADL